MSRKLGAAALALAILVGALAVKTVATAGASGPAVMANGPDPLPIMPPPHRKPA